jgi:hypothetical protein
LYFGVESVDFSFEIFDSSLDLFDIIFYLIGRAKETNLFSLIFIFHFLELSQDRFLFFQLGSEIGFEFLALVDQLIDLFVDFLH